MSRATTDVTRHALAYATGSVVGGITRAVLLPVLARRLSTEEYGAFALLLAATNLLHLIFEMGLVTALIRFHHDTAEPAERRRLRASLFLFMPLADLLLVVPMLAGRNLFSQALFGTAQYGLAFGLAVGTAFFAAQLQLFLGALRADDRSREYALLMVGKGAITLSLTLWLVLARDMGILGFLAGAMAGPAVLSLLAIPRALKRYGYDFTGARERVRELLAFGLPLVPSAIGFWLLTHLDVYLLRILADLDVVGLYGFASEICLPIAVLTVALLLAWPSFAFARARQPGGPQEIARVFRHLFVGIVGGSLLLVLLRREIVMVIGTEKFFPSLVVIPLLALSTCLYVASQVFATGLQVAGNTRRLPVFVALAVLTNGILNTILIPKFQGVGAAVATVITNLVLCALILRESNRLFPIPWETRRYAATLLAAAGTLAAADLLGDLSWWTGVMARTAFVLLYPLLLVPLGVVAPRELATLPKVMRAVLRREGS